ncbi:MAG: hypothetical protein QM537_05435 [Candidatus Symbiobacter sp.]|nr:hypothetical protein [Candidatus Symbiobacter sp.]
MTITAQPSLVDFLNKVVPNECSGQLTKDLILWHIEDDKDAKKFRVSFKAIKDNKKCIFRFDSKNQTLNLNDNFSDTVSSSYNGFKHDSGFGTAKRNDLTVIYELEDKIIVLIIEFKTSSPFIEPDIDEINPQIDGIAQIAASAEFMKYALSLIDVCTSINSKSYEKKEIEFHAVLLFSFMETGGNTSDKSLTGEILSEKRTFKIKFKQDYHFMYSIRYVHRFASKSGSVDLAEVINYISNKIRTDKAMRDSTALLPLSP